MTYRYRIVTQSDFHIRPCNLIASRAQELSVEYGVDIEVYNPDAKGTQVSSGKANSIFDLLCMSLIKGSNLEVIVRGNVTEEIKRVVAEDIGCLISSEHT